MAFASRSGILHRGLHIADAPAESPHSAHSDGVREAGHRTVSGVKVVAMLGPASRSPAVLDALLAAGVSCFRLDVSSARPVEWHLESYDLVQARFVLLRCSHRVSANIIV